MSATLSSPSQAKQSSLFSSSFRLDDCRCDGVACCALLAFGIIPDNIESMPPEAGATGAASDCIAMNACAMLGTNWLDKNGRPAV
jgi:hypothetical protein